MDLRETLFELVVRHGPTEVKTQFDAICKKLYEDLGTLYGQESKKEKKVETRGRKKKAEPKQEEQEQEDNNSVHSSACGSVEDHDLVDTYEPVEEPPQEPLRSRIIKKQPQNIVVEKVEEHGGIDKEDMQLLDPKEQQRLAVEAKHQELLAEGIDPESLLTKENLEKWLKSGKSYQKIARDYVGLHESIVSAKAKEFSLKSVASKYKFIRKK
jgi:hypothetical protein